MSQQAAEGQEPGAASGQEPDESQGQEPGEGQAPAGGTQQFATLEEAAEAATRATQAAAEANREAAATRKRLRDLEAAEQQRKQEGMTELEKMTARAEAAEQERDEARNSLATRDFRDNVTEAARALGFRNPGLAHRLVEQPAVLADDGKLDSKKLDAALRDVLKAEPYLGTAAGADAGAGRRAGTGQGQPSMNDLIRERAGTT